MCWESWKREALTKGIKSRNQIKQKRSEHIPRLAEHHPVSDKWGSENRLINHGFIFNIRIARGVPYSLPWKSEWRIPSSIILIKFATCFLANNQVFLSSSCRYYDSRIDIVRHKFYDTWSWYIIFYWLHQYTIRIDCLNMYDTNRMILLECKWS